MLFVQNLKQATLLGVSLYNWFHPSKIVFSAKFVLSKEFSINRLRLVSVVTRRISFKV